MFLEHGYDKSRSSSGRVLLMHFPFLCHVAVMNGLSGLVQRGSATIPKILLTAELKDNPFTAYPLFVVVTFAKFFIVSCIKLFMSSNKLQFPSRHSCFQAHDHAIKLTVVISFAYLLPCYGTGKGEVRCLDFVGCRCGVHRVKIKRGRTH
mgnify:CR=1 FL=1